MNGLKRCKNKEACKSYDLQAFDLFCIATGGELGIRTPGPVTDNSFQDCRNRPLCQLSICESKAMLYFDQIFMLINKKILHKGRIFTDYQTKMILIENNLLKQLAIHYPHFDKVNAITQT